MSRKKKLQRRKSINTSQQEADKPELNPQMTRRKWLKRTLSAGAGVGTGLVMWRMGLFDVFKEEEVEKVGQQPAPTTPAVEPKLPEYSEWASKIELPNIEIIQEDFDLQEHLLKDISPEETESFKRDFMDLKKSFVVELANETDVNKRMDLIKSFINHLVKKSSYMVHYDNSDSFPLGSEESNKILSKLNKLLLKIGYFFTTSYEPETNNYDLGILEIEKVKSVKISGIDKNVPTISLGNDRHYYSHSDQNSKGMGGGYERENQVILINKAEIQSNFDNKSAELIRKGHKGGVQPEAISMMAESDHRNAFYYHEAMHAAFEDIVNKMGLESKGNEQTIIKRSETINMGSYLYPSEAYLKYNDMQVHELVGHGAGLLHSGDAARIVALEIADGTGEGKYSMSAEVIIQEIRHSPDLPENIRNQFKGEYVNSAIMGAAINSIPIKTFHKIGERMVKLGMYLTQE